MSPNPAGVAKPHGHEWTKFEIHAVLCLMSRNIHVRGLPVPAGEEQGTSMAAGGCSQKSRKKRAELPHVSKRSAHMDVATALNRALNGLDISQDIDHREVSTMIDQIVIEKKGSLAVVQRQKPKRMTRFVKQVLRRKIGFTGNREEWDAGRKEEVEKLESERAERGFAMAMAVVSDAVLANDDGLGEKTAVAPIIDNSQAVDPWGGEPVLTSVEKQDTVPWGEAPAAAPIENQTATEVGWGAGRTTPEEFRANRPTGCDNDGNIPMSQTDVDNAGWSSGSHIAMLTTTGADKANTSWSGGTVAPSPASSSTVPWDSAITATFETKHTIIKKRGVDFISSDQPWLNIGPAPGKISSSDAMNWVGGSSAVVAAAAARTISTDTLDDTAVASVESSTGFFSDAWGGFENELENINPALLSAMGATEPWGGADTGFNNPLQTSSSELGNKGYDKAPPAASADTCRGAVSEKFSQTGSLKPLDGSGTPLHSFISPFRMPSDQWGSEGLTRVSTTIPSSNPETSALSSSSVTCSREIADSSSENTVHRTLTAATTSPSNFFGSETHDQSFISLSTAQTSPFFAADQGINSDRLALLQEQHAYDTSVFVDDTLSDDDSFQENQKRWMPKGGNALPLPFNRLARWNQIDDMNFSNDQSGNDVGADLDVKMEAVIEVMDMDEQGGEGAMGLENDEE